MRNSRGSAGANRMRVPTISQLPTIAKAVRTRKVRPGKYLPQAILGVEIPKENGNIRLLGIPTVTDRLLQQAVLQVMMARFEFGFSDSSFGCLLYTSDAAD